MRLPIANQSHQALDAMPSTARGEARIHCVRSVRATEASLKGYGRPIADMRPGQVTIVPWPQPGWRPLVPGTGDEGGTVRDLFEMRRAGGVLHAINHAVQRRYLLGWYGDPASTHADSEGVDTTSILTHEANYHPDGGQIFVPREAKPFVALLALPGDDVTPDDFVAFWFDGSFGVHIDPGVWHQPMFPCGDALSFDDEQGRVHACIGVDFVEEFGTYLEVPLVEPRD